MLALLPILAAARGNASEVRFGYFVDVMPHLTACARGWLDTPEFTVGCLPQSSGTFAVAKLEDGLLDMAMIGSAPFASAMSRGSDIVGVHVYAWGQSNEGLVSRQLLGSPAELAGATIGVPVGSTSHYQLVFFLELLGLSDLVTVENMSPTQISEAWDAGTIDAGFCWGDTFHHMASSGTRPPCNPSSQAVSPPTAHPAAATAQAPPSC